MGLQAGSADRVNMSLAQLDALVLGLRQSVSRPLGAGQYLLCSWYGVLWLTAVVNEVAISVENLVRRAPTARVILACDVLRGLTAVCRAHA